MTPDLSAVAAAEARLLRTAAALTDAQAAEPSRLPGWTRAMLLTHVARNASSNAAMVAAALRGQRRDQYPGGPDDRAAQIEAGRGRTAAELLADLSASAREWAAVMAEVGDDQWSLTVPAGVGDRPIAQRIESRLLEVEVHHADLGLGYGFASWPESFARPALIKAAERVGAQFDGDTLSVDGGAVVGSVTGLLAWLLGRESVAAAGLLLSGDPAVADFPAAHPF